MASRGLTGPPLRTSAQAIIGNYAVPILEEKQVWGTSDQTRTAYLDTQDVAKMTMATLRSDATVAKTMTLAGPKAWTVAEVIELCEKYADADAEVRHHVSRSPPCLQPMHAYALCRCGAMGTVLTGMQRSRVLLCGQIRSCGRRALPACACALRSC